MYRLSSLFSFIKLKKKVLLLLTNSGSANDKICPFGVMLFFGKSMGMFFPHASQSDFISSISSSSKGSSRGNLSISLTLASVVRAHTNFSLMSGLSLIQSKSWNKTLPGLCWSWTAFPSRSPP